MGALLSLERLSKRYQRRPVLTATDLALAEGEFVLLTGENGAGKTTLLRMLARTLPSSSGRVTWTQVPDAVEARRRTAYIAHQPLLYHELTALENVALVLRVHGFKEPTETARTALAGFAIRDAATEPVARLSRGQQQRVALARAFALRPELLLLDEPGTSLDADGRDQLFRYLEELRGTTTIVLATHEPDTYRGLATRRWDLRAGRLTETPL